MLFDFDNVTTLLFLIFAGGTAIGTLGLAIFAFTQIRQINKEYKERKLFEIMQWATTAIEWDFTDEDNDRLQNSKNPWITSWIIISHHVELLMSISRTRHIMDNVAIGFKRPILTEKIKSLLTQLIIMQQHLIDLQKHIDITATQTPPNFLSALANANTQKSQLRKAANDLLNESSNLI